MNLNLFLLPDEAKEEFNMKLAAQKAALQTELTMMGYKAIMQQGLKLHEAYTKQTGNRATNKHVYNRMVFGGAFVCACVCVCDAVGLPRGRRRACPDQLMIILACSHGQAPLPDPEFDLGGGTGRRLQHWHDPADHPHADQHARARQVHP